MRSLFRLKGGFRSLGHRLKARLARLKPTPLPPHSRLLRRFRGKVRHNCALTLIALDCGHVPRLAARLRHHWAITVIAERLRRSASNVGTKLAGTLLKATGLTFIVFTVVFFYWNAHPARHWGSWVGGMGTLCALFGGVSLVGHFGSSVGKPLGLSPSITLLIAIALVTATSGLNWWISEIYGEQWEATLYKRATLLIPLLFPAFLAATALPMLACFRLIERRFAVQYPDSFVVARLVRVLRWVSQGDRWYSTSERSRMVGRLDEVARCLTYAFPRHLRTGDPKLNRDLARRSAEMAEAVRSLVPYVQTPRQETRSHLINELRRMVRVAAMGEWDLFPKQPAIHSGERWALVARLGRALAVGLVPLAVLIACRGLHLLSDSTAVSVFTVMGLTWLVANIILALDPLFPSDRADALRAVMRTLFFARHGRE